MENTKQVNTLEALKTLQEQMAKLREQASNLTSQLTEADRVKIAEQSKLEASQVNKDIAELKQLRQDEAEAIKQVRSKYAQRKKDLRIKIQASKSSLTLMARKFLDVSRNGKWQRHHDGTFTKFHLTYQIGNAEPKVISFTKQDHDENRPQLVKRMVEAFGVSEKSVGSELTNHFANGNCKRDYSIKPKN